MTRPSELMEFPVGQFRRKSQMNYKQTEQFKEKKALVLFMLANNQIDLTDQGSKVPIIQINKILGIKNACLYRSLNSLETEGFIKCTHSGYQVGKESKRYLIEDKADSILNNEDLILKFNIINNQYYKSINNYYHNIPNVITFNSHNNISENFNNFQDDNIGYYIHINNNIDYLNSLITENNNYTSIQTISNLRFEQVTKYKKISLQVKGRAFNALCFTKSGKKTYLKSDKRLNRKDYLKINGYQDYIEVFDIKTEIPRLTYILQGGNYDDIQDFYIVAGLDREAVKKFTMSAYFGKSAKAESWHSLRRFLQDKKVSKVSAELREIWNKEFYKVWDHIHNLMKPIDSEIFLWTSLWEQLIIKEAREQLGIILLNVYDGFYYKDINIKNELERIAKETSVIVKNKYKGI